MKVKELIDVLSKMPSDIDVIVNGFEGFDDVDEARHCIFKDKEVVELTSDDIPVEHLLEEV